MPFHTQAIFLLVVAVERWKKNEQCAREYSASNDESIFCEAIKW